MRISEGSEDGQAGLRILVVDDNEDAANSLSELLGLMGHHVDTFHDGFGAAAAAPALRPDVAVLDIGMPGMSGLELAQKLRLLTPDTLLVACTGWGTPRDRELTAAAGFHHHLVKPAGIDELECVLPRGSKPAWRKP